MNGSFPRQKLYNNNGTTLRHSERFVSHTSNEPVSLWQKEFNFKVQEEVRTKLSKILSDKSKFLKTSVVYFGKFDKDDNKKLDYREFKDFLFMLTSHFQLPPLSEQAALRIFYLYEKRKLEFLNLTEFQKLFWNVLKSIQKVFFIQNRPSMPRSNLVFHFDSSFMANIKDLYLFEKKIGSGTFGEIFIVREICTRIQRACKLINFAKSGDELECLLTEVDILKTLDHPNIIRIIEVLQEKDTLYIIMEVCYGGELAKKLENASHKGRIFTEPYVSEIMEQLLEGINYMHSNCIVHRDLKPENILFTDSEPDSSIKIIDFGLAERFYKKTAWSNQIAGTCYYMAPEVFFCCVSFKCDIWSLGCILFQLLTNELPFPGDLFEVVQDLILNSEPDYSHFNKRPISSDAIDLVQRMLQKDPKRRPTAKECLNSPWFRHCRTTSCFMSSKVIHNLKCYQRLPILKRIFLNMLIHQQGIRKHELFEINNLFRMLDQNRNGVICREKFAKVLLKENLSIDTINDIFNATDIDNSGTISYTEFASACVSWNQFISIDSCQMIFNKMDFKKKNYTTYEQVAKVITRNSKQINTLIPEEYAQNKNQILKLIQSIDTKKKGYIDIESFLEYMLDPSSVLTEAK